MEAKNVAVADEIEEVRMTFGEHLEELRWRLVKSLVAWLACFIVAICFYEKLVHFICLPHVRAMEWLGIEGAAAKLQSGGYAKPIFAVMKLSFIVATAASSPVWLYQIWAFVSAGLYKDERKYVKRYSLPSFLLFIGGCVFGYFVLIPVGLYGMASMLNLKEVLLQFMFQDYLDLVMTLTIVTGAIFELPLVMMFLTSIGLVQPNQWWKWSRYAIVAIFLTAAILTPSPDVFTQVLMAAPLTILYFIGLGLSWTVRKDVKATAK